MSEAIQIEITYALPHDQALLTRKLPSGVTAEQAIRESGLLEKHPEIDLGKNKIGIFGKLAKLDTVLRDKDRVEIYRPLIADPKEVRKQRAEEGKAMKKGGGDIASAEAE
ncbi:MAG: RnfH family protein [Gammaproteobacteria bacterium]|nr:RnfH family protein [Gammaproteobacteria bacterium]MBU1731581.1 RnfH family protein [Gammaproteobacteria bacterium]MBU1893741.1 RnfH family protein [Gammaproteobacteria bacterium]